MATKEAVAQHVQKLMSNQKNIRNMGIVAHVDHGKCVSGDTKLQLVNGNIENARNIYNKVASSSINVKDTFSEQVYDASTSGLSVFSLNKQTGKIEVKPVQFAWKLTGGKVIKVKLRNGLQLSTTPEHKYVTLENLSFVEKTADQLNIGDAVVCPKYLQVQQATTDELKVRLLHNLSVQGFYVRLEGSFFGEFRATLIEKFGTFKHCAELCGLSKDNFSSCLKRKTFQVSDFANLCNKISLPLSIAYNGVSELFYRQGGAKSKNSKPMKLPQNFEDFFFIAGLMFGDGSHDKLVVGKPALGKLFEEKLLDLGIKPFYRNYAGKTPEISAGSTTLLQILHVVFGYPLKLKSRNIYASEFLLSGNDKCLGAFLRGYFDCDGTVEKSRGAISITSASAQMLRDMQLILLRFNCASILQNDTLYISGNSVKRFNGSIGFSLEEKRTKALELEKRVVGSYALDVVPVSKDALSALRGSSSMSSLSSNYYGYESGKTTPTVSSLGKIAQKIQNGFLQQLCSEELAFIEIIEKSEGFEEEVFDFTVADNHNFVAEGMFVHNTTLSDTLVARAGLISKELAGEQRVLDYDVQEQARGITIKAANISIAFKYCNEDYLINLIDTPGHVDFGGHVTRAMRAVDGIILVVDCVEGIMPQTETVLRQALKEKVKPVLFINKIDRFINELKLDNVAMQQRFLKIISGVNKLIENYGPPEFKEAWEIKVEKGNVAFGTAFNKWALAAPIMKEKKISFKDIYDKCVTGSHKELQQLAPLDDVILEMVVNNLPNPIESQRYRIPTIWHGDQQTDEGKAMMNCDATGPACFVITAIQTDPHAGEVAVGRLYSGTITKGTPLIIASQYKEEKVQQVALYMGQDRIMVDNVPAGNIVALVGLHDVYAGETVSSKQIVPFEQIKHHSEPVVTKSIEAKNPKDLVKLVEVLHKIAKEDPTLRVEINQQTGEHLISGMGELHLEIIEYKIEKERGVAITTSPPIVVYHEAILSAGPTLEGKSPNKHNKFKISVEPLEASVVKAFEAGEIHDKMKGKDLQERLIKAGLPRDEAKKVYAIYDNNLFVDVTKGVQYLQDIQELLIQAFLEAMKAGPLAKEECVNIKVKLEDATIHVDPAHRGPAQLIPAVKRPIFAGMLTAKAVLLEPKQKLVVTAPSDYMSGIIGQIQGRRGQILDMQQEGEAVNITAKVPVSEMFGFASEIRGASQGRAVWYTEYAGYEKMPQEMQNKTILSIRKRKGEPEQLPTAQFFMD